MRRATILTAALAVLGAAGSVAPHPASASQDQPPATAPTTQPATDYADPQSLAQLLHDPAAPSDQREFAAQRLLSIGTVAAVDHVARALAPTAAPNVQLAAAAAISASGKADPRLLEPLLALLASDGPANVRRETGRALANFREDPEVTARLVAVAMGNGVPASRQGAVAGLARIPQKASVQTLVALLDETAPEAVEREAGEALRNLTGREMAADDLAGWRNWWAQVSALDEAALKAQLLDQRSAEAVANARRADSATAALLATSQQRYRGLAPPQQVALLEEYLRSPYPELREVAVRLVLVEEVNYARDVPANIMRLVRLAITDPDSRVRGVAALIVQRRNDTAGVEPLLTQVGRETNPPARVEQIRALGSLGDPSALPMLLGLLNEPSPSVRIAAARAASQLAGRLDSNAVRQAAAAIRRAYEETDAASRSGMRQRTEMITALADLNEPALASFYLRILDTPSTPTEILRQALRGAATLGEPSLSDVVARFVTHSDPAVQEQAVRALGRTSLGFERREVLQALLVRNDVPEPVRRAAWAALVELFPKARTSDLVSLAEFLGRNDQNDKRLIVLESLAARAERDNEPEQLAWRQHEMADLLMTHLNQPAPAAELWQKALEYSIANGPASTLQTRAENALRCHLRARQFDSAITFAREMVGRDPAFRESVGTIVKREADELVKAGQTTDAGRLIDAVLNEDPPLLNALSRSQLETQRRSLPAAQGGA